MRRRENQMRGFPETRRPRLSGATFELRLPRAGIPRRNVEQKHDRQRAQTSKSSVVTMPCIIKTMSAGARAKAESRSTN
jgi:hypothetical protein